MIIQAERVLCGNLCICNVICNKSNFLFGSLVHIKTFVVLKLRPQKLQTFPFSCSYKICKQFKKLIFGRMFACVYEYRI